MTTRKAPRQVRRPTQRRSVVTVDAILEAAAQLMTAKGTTRVSVNDILRRAGVSAGSFYQYFASRDALMVALIELHATGVLERLGAALQRTRSGPLRDIVNAVVGGLVDELNAPLRRLLMGDLARLGRVNDLTHRVDTVVLATVQNIFEERVSELGRKDPATAAFLVVRATELLASAAALERPELLKGGILRRELCDLVYGFLILPA